MTAPRWGSLVAGLDGEIQSEKLRTLAAILLAVSGGAVLVAAMTGLIHPPTDILLIGVSALVLPLTGGKVMDGIAKMRGDKSESPAPGDGAQ